MMKPSRPSPLSLYLHPEVIKLQEEAKALGTRLPCHYSLSPLHILNKIKEKRLKAALAQNMYTFPSLKKEKEGMSSLAR